MGIDVRHAPKTVLFLGQRSPETGQVLTLLSKRPDLRIVHVPMLESVPWALRGLPANLVLVGPELPGSLLLELFSTVEKLRPGVPVVALRPRVDEEWAAALLPSLTVLARPFPAPVLLRLVDMALGAGRAAEATRADSGMPN